MNTSFKFLPSILKMLCLWRTSSGSIFSLDLRRLDLPKMLGAHLGRNSTFWRPEPTMRDDTVWKCLGLLRLAQFEIASLALLPRSFEQSICFKYFAVNCKLIRGVI